MRRFFFSHYTHGWFICLTWVSMTTDTVLRCGQIPCVIRPMEIETWPCCNGLYQRMREEPLNGILEQRVICVILVW
ncbi:hypothetical protein BX600DRAFT_461114 [Xylariales sp. PMI_506]|nr:hypothetical protein BX600DRAFT_461114 [Xylariales sp. PMI_506]